MKEIETYNPFLNIGEQKNKNIYDTDDLSPGFKIEGNIVSTDSLDGRKHAFVFAHQSKNIKMGQKGEFIIKYNILKENKWLALGLCDKKIVKESNYIFGVKSMISNGCFIL